MLWRPDPRDLAELADRLDEPDSIDRALASLPLPAVQLCEALTALGGSAPPVYCWCHSADDTRVFRIDRIRAVRP